MSVRFYRVFGVLLAALMIYSSAFAAKIYAEEPLYVSPGWQCWQSGNAQITYCDVNYLPVGIGGYVGPNLGWLFLCYVLAEPKDITDSKEISFDFMGTKTDGVINYEFKLERGDCHVGCRFPRKNLPSRWITVSIELLPPGTSGSCFKVIQNIGCVGDPWTYVTRGVERATWDAGGDNIEKTVHTQYLIDNIHIE